MLSQSFAAAVECPGLMPRLLQDGGLVVLWMTNRERLHKFVEKQLLPAWGLELVATWWWAKITPSGHPVQPLVCFCLSVPLYYKLRLKVCTA